MIDYVGVFKKQLSILEDAVEYIRSKDQIYFIEERLIGEIAALKWAIRTMEEKKEIYYYHNLY